VRDRTNIKFLILDPWYAKQANNSFELHKKRDYDRKIKGSSSFASSIISNSSSLKLDHHARSTHSP
jgi:hypothetical protein